MIPPRWRFAAPFVIAGSALVAQDVTTLDPVWLRPGSPPEVLPKPSHRLRPEFPEELSKVDEIGYVLIDRFIYRSGGDNLIESVEATHLSFRRAVEVAAREWTLSPAKRDGHPIDGHAGVTVIFNPKSASTRGANATPRLLHVTPVLTPTLPPGRPGSTRLLRARLSLDETGTVVDVTPEAATTAPIQAAVSAALKAWRFAPARQNGKPVAASVTLPVICQLPPKPGAEAFSPARVIKREYADYPLALLGTGLRAEVQVDCDIDTEGRVSRVNVRSSNSPPFEAAAIRAARATKYQAATNDGTPVSSQQTVTFTFEPPDARDAYAVTSRGDNSKLPPALQFDTPAKTRSVLVPVYPYALRRDAVRGDAKARLLIDVDGSVREVKVHQADRPEFGLALKAAVEGFAFDPALKSGRPVMQLIEYSHAFNERSEYDEDAGRLLSLERRHPEEIVAIEALDTPLKPISRRPALFPKSLDPSVTTGKAEVEFLIGRDGSVHLPRIVSATDDAFGYAATQAASAWLYEPPTVAGKTVVVRVRAPLAFTRTAPAAPKTKSTKTAPKP